MKLNGILGSGRGKLGNSVFAVRRGETIVRQYQPVVANPNTYRQRVSRARFAYASQLARALSPALEIGYAMYRAEMSPRNQFIRRVAAGSEIIRIGDDGAVVTNDMLPISRGTMPTYSFGELSSETPLTVDVAVTPTTIPDLPAYGDGKVGMVLVAKPDGLDYAVTAQVVEPSGSTSFTVPREWSGLRVHVWAFMKWVPTSYNGVPTDRLPWKFPSEASDSVYLGMVTVA